MEGSKPQEGWPPYGISQSKPQYLWGTPLCLQSGSLCLTLRLESHVALRVRAPCEVTWITASVHGDTGDLLQNYLFSLMASSRLT